MTDHLSARPEEVDIQFDKPLLVRLIDAESLQAEYTNFIHVNFDRAAFQVIFSQFFQPLITAPDDATQLAERGYVPARPLARLVLSPLMMQQTIDILQRQLNAYLEQFGDRGNDEQFEAYSADSNDG